MECGPWRSGVILTDVLPVFLRAFASPRRISNLPFSPYNADIRGAPERERLSAAYNAAADQYDALGFWGYYGARSAARADLRPDEIVLDVCSGAGASATPAARA